MSVKRDFKPENTWKKRQRVRLHGLIVIALGLIALVAGLWAYVAGDWKKEAGSTSNARTAPPPQPVQTQPIPLPQQPKPKYDFYSELPKRQIKIPKEEITPPPPPPTAAPAPRPQSPAASSTTTAKPRTGRGYVIQAGSFRNQAQAERLKATLALLGIEARIETSTGSNNVILHRIRIGPIADPSEVQALRRRLQQNNIPSIAIKAN